MSQRYTSALLLLCLSVAACAHAPTQSTTPAPGGVTYYVAPEGDDTNDGRDASAPFRTVARAFKKVAPGDTIYLRDGVYHEYLFGDDSCRTSGREGSPITLESYPGETAVFDGSDMEPNLRNLSAPNLIYLGDCDWYVLRNLVFRNAAGRAIQAGRDSDEHLPAGNKLIILESSDHNIFENLTIYGNQSDGIYLVGDHNIITNVKSFDNNSTLNGGESADGIKLAFGNENVIRCSVTYQNSDDGVDIWGSSGTLVEFNRSYQNGSGANGDGNGFKLGSGAVGPVPSNSLARFNTAYLNRSNNFDDNGGQGITLYNNTSWQAGEFGFVVGHGSNILVNNISFQDKRGSVSSEGAETSNSWNVGVTDPDFADVTAQPPDLSLSAASPAIDAGSDVGLPFTGSAPDLGAFEYEQETMNPCEEHVD